MFPFLILGKVVSYISRTFGIGSGGTWPGEIVLRFDSKALERETPKVTDAIILIAGTNGKTTTSAQIKNCLASKENNIVHNASGANLENGILSAFIQKERLIYKKTTSYAILECDENTLPLIIPKIYKSKLAKTKFILVLLNLFRDQLDRYGEVDAIARKWNKSLSMLNEDATVILNADDPQVASLGNDKKAKCLYFGLSNPSWYTKLEHATDSTLCPRCGKKLFYEGVYFSHLGVWQCDSCGLKRPSLNLENWESYLSGLYNRYNTMAAASVLRVLGLNDLEIKYSFQHFLPAFGRQEELKIGDKKVKIFLSKNPTGFNASLKTVLQSKPKFLLLVLNDKIPDGRDVSWIWDVDFEIIPQDVSVIVSGDRAYDLGLRIKYTKKQRNPTTTLRASNETMQRLNIIENLKDAVSYGLSKINNGAFLYILPTYSAMLEVRKILKGRKIF